MSQHNLCNCCGCATPAPRRHVAVLLVAVVRRPERRPELGTVACILGSRRCSPVATREAVEGMATDRTLGGEVLGVRLPHQATYLNGSRTDFPPTPPISPKHKG